MHGRPLRSSWLLAVTIAACATTKAIQVERPYWPLPPDPPRIRYVRTLASSLDLKDSPSSWEKVTAFFLGVRSVPLFTKPFGVAVKNDRIYVTDPPEGRVVVFDLNARIQSFLGDSGPYRLARPYGIAAGEDGAIYLADLGLLRVMVFESDGTFRNAYGRPDMLVNPIAVAVDDERRRLYLTDSYRHQVMALPLDGGEPLFMIGKQHDKPDKIPEGRGNDHFWNRGEGEGEFNFPTYIQLDAHGRIYVVDSMNFRVQVFSPDGAFLRSVGSLGRSFGNFARPKGIALDDDGNLYVADAAFNNIQIFNPQGDLLMFFGSMGHDPGQFWLLQGLCATGDNLYAVDVFNHRLQIFERIESATEGENKG